MLNRVIGTVSSMILGGASVYLAAFAWMTRDTDVLIGVLRNPGGHHDVALYFGLIGAVAGLAAYGLRRR